MTISVMALFCEDIREEKDGIVSLMGILPDNLSLSPLPTGTITPGDATARFLGKLCIYTRINFDPTYELPEAELRLVLPNQEVIPLGKIETATINQAKSEATTKGIPLAGVISRAVMAGFRAPIGVVRLEVIVGQETHVAGAVVFHSIASSSAPPPPA